MRYFVAGLCLMAALAACSPTSPVQPADTPPDVPRTAAVPAPAPSDDQRPWHVRLSPATQSIASYESMRPAIRASLTHLAGKPESGTAMVVGDVALTYGQLKTTLERLDSLLPELDRDPTRLAEHFAWVTADEQALLTGYYEPWLEASLTPHPNYPHPLYSSPGKGRKPSRAAIDFEGALRGKGYELAWAKSLIDVFFLQVQGSGRLLLPDGSTKNVVYGGSNGHKYVAVGRVLVERGDIAEEEKSMQRIRRFFEEHPDKVQEVLSKNPSYIFFKLAEKGPVGGMGVVLTPYVSAATDPSFLPYGALLAVDAMLPGFPEGSAPERFTGLLLAQDTGCMKGHHVDLFCGAGHKAAFQAGHMKDTAAIRVLVAREALTPGQAATLGARP
ncbi:transglycosylase [Desulfovibrio sulfodismutans]|uniref:peptidoglycan lytic exotransglycosylase n=1 Tax=Desulfolutivibrio sulfodismutans TaxID=63561 RepID=A0A7K3NJ69_9BACT|nr:MltA domain-containing protein [Desulfolutivibrio sulfodismutans]NDY56137.1 transglycosylase [Desulfolutivibrio sulfodismutans]QLA13189.1 transglycosylase [Desulfolutivibrio sulfodismutans DSM 3696]